VQNRVAAGEWRKDQQATDWIGKVIAAEIDVDLSDKAGKARVSQMLRAWIGSGALRVVEHQDKNREDKKFVEVGEWAT